MAEEVLATHRVQIMHARMTIDNQVSMGSDAPADRFEPMKGFSVSAGQYCREGGKDLQSSGGERIRLDANTEDLLGRTLRRAARSIRHTLDG